MATHTTHSGISNDRHVLGIVKSDNVRDSLKHILDDMDNISSNIVMGDLLVKKKKNMPVDQDCSVVLLEIDSEDQDHIPEVMEASQDLYGKRKPPIIVISQELDHRKITQFLHQGVNDFLTLPLAEDETKKSVQRLVSQTRRSGRSDKYEHKIITFAHASGGMGATTLAVNAATIINANSKKKKRNCCLLDLDLQYGGASVHLDLPEYSPVMDVLNNPERLDQEMLERMMVRHSSGLHVLTTPELPLPVEAVSGDALEKLLNVARSRYLYTFVDMPHTMTLWADKVFSKSEIIYVVTQLNVVSIRQLKRWFFALEQEGLHMLPIKIIVNCYSSVKHSYSDNISLAQASEAIGRPIDYFIPEDHDLISQSLDQGMPAAKIRPRSKFIQSLKTMLNETIEEIDIPKSRLFGSPY